MTKSYPDILALSRTVLRLVIKLNLLMGVLIRALLLASLIWETFILRALGVRPADSYPALLIGLRVIMVIGICGVPVVHFVLTSSVAVPLHFKYDFSLTPWLAVLLLFVLARVFEQGAHMREDLEGTV